MKSAIRAISLLALVGASLTHAGEGVERLHRYTVSVNPDLRRLEVRACFAGKPPLYLVSESLDAASALQNVRVEGVRRKLEPNGAELKLGTLPDDSCVRYEADFTSFRGVHKHGGNPTRQVGRDLITDLGMWFWRPESLAQDEDIEVRFELPPGIAASAPWRVEADAEGRRVYRVGHTPYDWPAAVAFGRFQEQELAVPGATLRVAVLEGTPAVSLDDARAWVTRAAMAVTTVYGRFPVRSAQILVVPGARGEEPVPWAYVLRGGGPSAHFFINQRRPLSEFLTDWTPVHELSHMLLPYIASEDAWLSEGAASYYQNVLRARAGMITADDAWQRMHAGFRRGMKSLKGVTLADATERMFRDGAFMRVYWSGAAIMLLADQRLRERTGGHRSLDRALDELARCCLGGPQAWRGRALMDKLDELTGTTVFRELHDSYLGSERFPDFAQAYARLGLRVAPDEESVELASEAPRIEDRDAIMRPPPWAAGR
jgi:hypothetical protein